MLKTLHRWLPIAAGALLALGAAPATLIQPASAKKPSKSKSAKAPPQVSKLRLGNLDSTLDGLKFGADEAAALKWVRLRLQHHYDPKLAKAIGVEKQRWTMQIEKEVEAIAAGVIEHKGGKSKVATSIIGNDFGRVPGERLMTVKVGTKKHYLLFDAKKRLWRYATSVPSAMTFKERAAQYSGRIGAPAVERATPKAFVGWMFNKHRVELRNERVMFGGDALIITHRALSAGLAKQAKALGTDGDDKDATAGLEDVIDTDPDKRAEEEAKAAEKELREHQRKQREAAKKRKK